MNIANQLTTIRIVMVPFFMYALLAGHEFIAAVLFGLAAFTDFLDGYLARKYNLVTNLGKLLDPLADKVLVMAAFVCLVELGEIPAWPVVIIISREMIISIFRAVAASEGVVIAASFWGKLKTNTQMAAVICLILGEKFFSSNGLIISKIIFWISVGVTVISGFDYIRKNRSVLKG